MKKNNIIISIIMFLFITNAYSQKKFVCFKNEYNINLQLSVCFDKNMRAKSVKYKGQRDSIILIYSGIERAPNDNPGGIPAVFWAETYLEKYKGKVTGTYVFTNAGTYQLDVTYTRKKDKKEFYFSIIKDSGDNEESVFLRNTPCF